MGGGERQFVTGRAEAADDAEGEVAEIGMLAKSFAAVDVRKMHFNEGDGNSSQCVAYGDAGVGIGGGVDDDEIDFVFTGFVDKVDKGAFMIVLDVFELVAEVLRHAFQAKFDVFQGVVAVVFGLAAAEQIQVGAVNDKY